MRRESSCAKITKLLSRTAILAANLFNSTAEAVRGVNDYNARPYPAGGMRAPQEFSRRAALLDQFEYDNSFAPTFLKALTFAGVLGGTLMLFNCLYSRENNQNPPAPQASNEEKRPGSPTPRR